MEAPSILAFRSDWPFEQLLAVSPPHPSLISNAGSGHLAVSRPLEVVWIPRARTGHHPSLFCSLLLTTKYKTHSNTNRTKPPRSYTQWTHPLLFYLWMLTLDIKWASLITLFYCWISDQHQQRYSCVFDHSIESWNKNLSIYPVVLKCEMDQYPALCATI